MTVARTAYRLGNWLFEHQYAVYRPLYGSWKAFSDRRERALARRILKPGMTVADVGANIGVYSRFFSRLVGPSGHVHAFEPAEQNYTHLTQTARVHPTLPPTTPRSAIIAAAPSCTCPANSMSTIACSMAARIAMA